MPLLEKAFTYKHLHIYRTDEC